MLNSKQRAFLRSIASKEDTILMLGKGGISSDIIKQADDALLARELIKGKVLESAPISVREAAEEIAEAAQAEIVQIVGRKFVLYRRNPDDIKITLPKAKKGD